MTLAEDTDENSRSVLDVSVNADWDEIVSSLDAMERSLTTLMTEKRFESQLSIRSVTLRTQTVSRGVKWGSILGTFKSYLDH